MTKPFVILTGLSGSGKTKLALAFAEWISETSNQICMVPVGADWTNREPLLGYPNALEERKYVLPESGALQLVLDASKNTNKPFFLILDEMNLSHVERYFADFLSVMESRQDISLHPGPSNWSGIPPKISLPKNLFIIGTVNIDETTYMFSPKVLDRANVIEFRVTEDEMMSFLESNKKINTKDLRSAGSKMAKSFLDISDLPGKQVLSIAETLIQFFKVLKLTGAEFGYRSASEIVKLTAVINQLSPQYSENEILDVAIMQKLLPKVHGSRRKLEPILRALAGLCLMSPSLTDTVFTSQSLLDSNQVKYPMSLDKIKRMYDSVIDNGFTSYAEA